MFKNFLHISYLSEPISRRRKRLRLLDYGKKATVNVYQAVAAGWR
jgi:hypothetical protein